MAVRHIVFRCDAAPEIGSGHVMRCLALAEWLGQSGDAITFLSSMRTAEIVPALLESGFEVKYPDAFSGLADVLVVDHYGLGVEYERECRSWAGKILVIDDLANRSHDCDFLVDQTFGRSPADYQGLVPDHCLILSGSHYGILRPQFAAARTESFERRIKVGGSIERILLFISGTDPHNVTGTVLGWLDSVEATWAIDVVTGTENFAEVEALAKKSHHQVFCHTRVQNMAALMAKADLAIGAGGTTSWERCCLGLPALVLLVADNQIKTAQELERAGAIVSLGRVASITKDAFIETFRSLSEEKLLRMSERARSICDGNGVSRLMSILNSEFDDVQTEIEFRPACLDDAAILLQWRNDPQTRKFSRNPDMVNLDEHLQWLNRQTVEGSTYIAQVYGVPVGTIRVEAKPENLNEISWTVAPEFRGKGIGKKMLIAARNLWRTPVSACIRNDNYASIKVAEYAGFVEESSVDNWLYYRFDGKDAKTP